MKQLHFNYCDDVQLRAELENHVEIRESKRFYFQLFASVFADGLLKQAISVIEELYPGAVYVAHSTAGNIQNCEEAGAISVVVNLFERESSQFEVIQYDFYKSSMHRIAAEIHKEVLKRPWVKAVEFYHTLPKVSTSFLCDELHVLSPEIQLFGGIVCGPDISGNDCFIFSSGNEMSSNGLICIFLGGDELYIDSIKISGWKAIGRYFKVTSANGNILKTLDGIPAYDVYNRYLNIQNDQNFFMNALDFPFMYNHNDTTIVRACGSSNEDGSIVMSANIDEGSIVQLSYGEPNTILDSVQEKSLHIREFQPEVLHIFSCAARKTFWTGHNPTYELHTLKSICSSSGFFSHGEFFREKGRLNQHNLTLVVASLREGEKQDASLVPPMEEHHEIMSTRLPLAARMATFIRETSYELNRMNEDLKAMNTQLAEVAKQDSLTGLGNRFAFNDMMSDIEEGLSISSDWTMYVFDVNGLKTVNDTFGHMAGDELIRRGARIVREVFSAEGHCFRVGGDEYVALVPFAIEDTKVLDAKLKEVMKRHNQPAVYHLSMAMGKSSIYEKNHQRKSRAKWVMDADLSMYRNKAAHQEEVSLHKDSNLEQMIACLISIVEAKDPYTAFHSDRVCAISEFLANKMGLTSKSIDIISDAAKLHDIGKVGISDAVLFKPGRLTEDEFAQIKEHPLIGAKILVQSNYMQDVVDIVLHHHERYDGDGYPHGLSGTDIPLGARIIALADSIDAMTSKRVYRESLPLHVCYDEIVKNIGKMYDPAIANIALQNWKDIVDLLARK